VQVTATERDISMVFELEVLQAAGVIQLALPVVGDELANRCARAR